ncbi:MAG TPA: hypothetical protein VN698_06760 [Bacteroidia bacterium]|nr:hypothetical protein [Bacteroidia bacterium]
MQKKTLGVALLLVLNLFACNKVFSQGKDSIPKHNVGILLSCSILESNGYRFETPAFFYSGKRHGFSVAAASKFENDKQVIGVTAGYFLFIEPAFRDISFFFNYNGSYFFESNPAFTHIFGGGVQIDLFKRFFLHHSVGLGFQHSATNFNFLNTAGQLKLSIGYYIREIPVTHIHDEWEH